MDLNLKQILESYTDWAKAKFGVLSKEQLNEAERRLKICQPCNNNVNNTCQLCGCPIKVKIFGKNSECPDKPKKW